MVGYESTPYFSGVPRQRGRGFGALAGTVARTAFPIIRKYFLPAAKIIGRDFVESSLPQIGEVVAGRTSVKRALKRSASNTVKKQLGGGKNRVTRKNRSTKGTKIKRRKTSTTRKKSKQKIIKRKTFQKNSDQDFFRNLPE